MEIEITPVYEMNPAADRKPAVDLQKIAPEEIEPLCVYNILKNDEGQLLLLLPGYFKGEPIRPEIQYNAGQHAVLARGPHQILLMDELNPALRGALATSERVLIREIDSKRQYVAEIVRAEVGPLGRTVLEAHRYFFSFHPYPIHDGTLIVGDAVCDYCQVPVKIYFKGRTDRNEVKCACPACIDRSEPVGWGESFFPEIDDRCIKGVNWSEVFGATVPYQVDGRVPAVWGVHCDALGVYLGSPEIEDLIPELREELEETWDNDLNCHRGETPEGVWKAVETGEDTGKMQLFRCSKCGKVFCIFV